MRGHLCPKARLLAVAILLLVGALSSSCGLTKSRAAAAGQGAGVSSPHRQHDPRTARALLRIARAFNDDYQQNNDAAVYARWDARSRAIVSRASFVQRHRDCPNNPHVKVVTWGVTRGPGSAWLVHYSIDGQQFTDWWYYVRGRFAFDLPRSNPSAVALYRAPLARYVKEMGCGH